MAYVSALRCRSCSREYPVEPLNVCDFCFGPLEVVYDYDAIARVISRERIASGPVSMLRYHDLLPIDIEDAVEIEAGFTPLVKCNNLGRVLGLENLYVKNDSVNPTFSFKDRVVTIAATKAREFGFDILACASTGNLACSVAAHAARAGMKAFVFIPANLERGKVVGAAIYNPTLIAVDGSYDEVNRLCSEIGDNYPWAFVNINIRPFYAEGSKTLAYEVAEQLNWRAPDHAVVPAASGSMFTKIWKGLKELSDLGLIGKVNTRMHVAQPEGVLSNHRGLRQQHPAGQTGAGQHHRQVAGHRQPHGRRIRAGYNQGFGRLGGNGNGGRNRRRNQAPCRNGRYLHRDRRRCSYIGAEAPNGARQDQARRGHGGLYHGKRAQDN